VTSITLFQDSELIAGLEDGSIIVIDLIFGKQKHEILGNDSQVDFIRAFNTKIWKNDLKK